MAVHFSHSPYTCEGMIAVPKPPDQPTHHPVIGTPSAFLPPPPPPPLWRSLEVALPDLQGQPPALRPSATGQPPLPGEAVVAAVVPPVPPLTDVDLPQFLPNGSLVPSWPPFAGRERLSGSSSSSSIVAATNFESLPASAVHSAMFAPAPTLSVHGGLLPLGSRRPPARPLPQPSPSVQGPSRDPSTESSGEGVLTLLLPRTALHFHPQHLPLPGNLPDTLPSCVAVSSREHSPVGPVHLCERCRPMQSFADHPVKPTALSSDDCTDGAGVPSETEASVSLGAAVASASGVVLGEGSSAKAAKGRSYEGLPCAPYCGHTASWERTRGKRGFEYFCCRECGARWKITNRKRR
eukprot:RCo054401